MRAALHVLLSPSVLTLLATGLGVGGLALFAVACWRRDADEADEQPRDRRP